MASILIVEDDSALNELYTDLFTDEEYVVYRAADGRSGLAIARQKQPNVILLDLVMPHMDGMSMLEEIRNDRYTKSIPVLVLTNLNSTPSLEAKFLSLAPVQYLLKAHTTPDEVVNAVQSLLTAAEKNETLG